VSLQNGANSLEIALNSGRFDVAKVLLEYKAGDFKDFQG
jgi:ankyrin repeat protein